MSAQVTYDSGPLYHYAESEPDLNTSDFMESSTQDDGYLPVDVEYEQPERRQHVSETPFPPRRVSVVSNSYPSIERPSDAPTLPPPRVPSKEENISVVGRLSRYVGLLGLIGLAGLGGAAIGKTSSSAAPMASSGSAPCVVGTVQWSAASGELPGHLVADGSSIDAGMYPELVDAIGPTLPDLIDRYARGGLQPGTTMDASVDASSLSVRVFDPGHSHVDSVAHSVKTDGSYSLAHLYSFTSSGMNLKEAGPAIVGAETGITAQIDGGSETRPASVVLVPHICFGAVKNTA